MKLSCWLSGIVYRHQYRRVPRTRRKHGRQYRCAEVCRLEQWQLLAAAVLADGVLSIDSAAIGSTAESVAIANDGTTITLSGDITEPATFATSDV